MAQAAHFQTAGDLPSARDTLIKALELAESPEGSSLQSVVTLNHLGELEVARGDMLEGIKDFQRALPLCENLGKLRDSSIAKMNSGLAIAALGAGQLQRSADAIHAGLSALEHVADSSAMRAYFLHLAGVVQAQRGDSVGAEDFYLQALPLAQLAQTTDPSVWPDLLNSIALLHIRDGRYQAAETELRQALEVQASSCPSRHAIRIASLVNLAHVLWHKKSYTEADDLAREAMDRSERDLPPGHALLGKALQQRALIARDLKHTKDSREYERRSEAILQNYRDRNHLDATVDYAALLHQGKR